MWVDHGCMKWVEQIVGVVTHARLTGVSCTVLQLSKRVHFYQCMLIVDFSGETCMYPDLTWYPVRSMDGLSINPATG
jgi:hypothetical protein